MVASKEAGGGGHHHDIGMFSVMKWMHYFVRGRIKRVLNFSNSVSKAGLYAERTLHKNLADQNSRASQMTNPKVTAETPRNASFTMSAKAG